MQISVQQILFVISFFVFIGFQCEVEGPEFEIDAKITLTPEQKIYTVGDSITLLFLMKEGKVLDFTTDKVIDFDEVILPFNLTFGGGSFNNTPKNFGIKVDENTEISNYYHSADSSMGFEIGCEKEKDDYSFGVTVFLNNPGIYFMNTKREEISSCDSLSNSYSYISYYFDVDDTNFELANQFSENVYSSESKKSQSSKKKFWFKVIEK